MYFGYIQNGLLFKRGLNKQFVFNISSTSYLLSIILDSDVFNELPCPGCNFDLEQCCCQKLTEIVKSTNMKLLEMQLIDRMAGSGLTALIKLKIKDHINDTCLGVFDRSHLKQLETVRDIHSLEWLIICRLIG